MGVKAYQSNFTNGEISDLMEGRIDFAKYFNSVHVMENMLVCPQGPAMLRPGFRFIAATKSNSTASRLMQFIFSDDDAFALEFGHQYVRFYKNRARITTTYTAWAASTYYKVGSLITSSGNYYRCKVAHTSGSSFDSTNWSVTTSTDTAYELATPFTSAQVSEIKFCQSCDVLYLFHPDTPPQKLMRVSDNDWYMQEINFRPPPMVGAVHQLPVSLTLSAFSGDDVTFEAGSPVFMTGDIGRMITYGAGRATITGVVVTSTNTTSTKAICDIIDDFSVTQIEAGEWSMSGDIAACLKPTGCPTVGSKVTLNVVAATREDDPLISLIDHGKDNWFRTYLTKDEYALYRNAAGYTCEKPTSVYVFQTSSEGTPGSLYDGKWGWGPVTESGLYYNTIHVKMKVSGVRSPDTICGVWRTTSTATRYVFRNDDVGKYISIFDGVLKIVTVTNGKSIICEVLKEMDRDSVYVDDDSDGENELQSTSVWNLYQGQWTEETGYPSCGAFYEDRLILAGVSAYPENIRGSVIGDYENFSTGVYDDASLDFTLNGRTVSKVRWIDPREYLIIGSLSDEWRLGPQDKNKALTPTNVVAKRQTNYGCADIDPLSISNCTLFVQGALRKIREFTLNQSSINDEYVAPDLTMLAEHATEGKIAGMCYQQEPLSIVWVWTEDGNLVSFTYKREEDVIGWQRHPMDNGIIESMISIPADERDEVYAIIKRTVNGSTVRYIEVLEKLFVDDNETYQENKGLNAFFVDSGITYNGTATTTITGLGHLNGETVAVLADGKVQANKTVTGGQITLTTAASVVHAGLSYTGKLVTVRPEVALKDGTSQGRIKRVLSLVVRVKDSGTFKTGRDEENLDEHGFLAYDQTQYQALYGSSDIPSGIPADLFTGEMACGFDGEFSRDARLTVVQDKPLPLTVVAVTAEMDVTE